MKRWLSQVGKRGLIVGGLLTAIGFAGVFLLRTALQGMNVETASIRVSLVFGLILGGSGFALVVLFELIGAGWNLLTGKKPAQPEPKDDVPPFPDTGR